MHRDQKIGLSLSVLIIGFAGAFCFRQETLTDAHPLAVDQVAAIDARIEHLPIRAYTEREGIGHSGGIRHLLKPRADVVDASVVSQPVEPMSVEVGGLEGDIVDLFAGPPEPLNTERLHTEAYDTRPPPTGLVLPPDVTETPAKKSPPRPTPPVVEDRTVAAAPPPATETESPVAPSGEASTALEPRTYVVKPGDTLSGIASRMYGSSRRYLDLYQANRDVLSNANDLPVGTTLRIP